MSGPRLHRVSLSFRRGGGSNKSSPLLFSVSRIFFIAAVVASLGPPRGSSLLETRVRWPRYETRPTAGVAGAPAQTTRSENGYERSALLPIPVPYLLDSLHAVRFRGPRLTLDYTSSRFSLSLSVLFRSREYSYIKAAALHLLEICTRQ